MQTLLLIALATSSFLCSVKYEFEFKFYVQIHETSLLYPIYVKITGPKTIECANNNDDEALGDMGGPFNNDSYVRQLPHLGWQLPPASIENSLFGTEDSLKTEVEIPGIFITGTKPEPIKITTTKNYTRHDDGSLWEYTGSTVINVRDNTAPCLYWNDKGFYLVEQSLTLII